MNARQSTPSEMRRERQSSASLGTFAQDSLEPAADLVQPNIEPTSDAQKRAEPRVDSAPLQLADAVELGADPLRKALLGQVGLPAQLLDRLPERGVGSRTWLAAARRRHSPREPFPSRPFALADLTVNSVLVMPARGRRRSTQTQHIFESAIDKTPSVPIECRTGIVRTYSVYHRTCLVIDYGRH